MKTKRYTGITFFRLMMAMLILSPAGLEAQNLPTVTNFSLDRNAYVQSPAFNQSSNPTGMVTATEDLTSKLDSTYSNGNFKETYTYYTDIDKNATITAYQRQSLNSWRPVTKEEFIYDDSKNQIRHISYVYSEGDWVADYKLEFETINDSVFSYEFKWDSGWIGISKYLRYFQDGGNHETDIDYTWNSEFEEFQPEQKRIQFTDKTSKDSTYHLEYYSWNSESGDWDVVSKMKRRTIFPTTDSATREMTSYWIVNSETWKDSTYKVYEIENADTFKYTTYIPGVAEGTWNKHIQVLGKPHGNVIPTSFWYKWDKGTGEWNIWHEDSVVVNENNLMTYRKLILYDQKLGWKDKYTYSPEGNLESHINFEWDTTRSDQWRPKFEATWEYDPSLLSATVMTPNNAHFASKTVPVKMEQVSYDNNGEPGTPAETYYYYSDYQTGIPGTILPGEGPTTWPNPATNYINFNWEAIGNQAIIHIYDVNGRLVLAKEISNHQQLSVSQLSEGVYLYRVITSGGKRLTGRMLIAR